MNQFKLCLAGLALLTTLAVQSETSAQYHFGFGSPPPRPRPVTTKSQPKREVTAARGSQPTGRAQSATQSKARKVSKPASSVRQTSQLTQLPDGPETVIVEEGEYTTDFAGEMVPHDAGCGCDTCDSCGDMAACGVAGPCVPCFYGGWVSAEFLMWWPRPMDIPALVTSGTPASDGVLGVPGTQVLLGDQMLDRMFTGGRMRLGLWADACRQYAWEADAFIIGRETQTETFSGTGATGSTVISRPFFNVLTSTEMPSGQEDAELVASPGELRGSVTVEATSQLYGVGIHGMRTFCQSCGCDASVVDCGCLPSSSQFAGFVGWRYLNFQEGLTINEDLTSLLPSPDNGRFLLEDDFQTANYFNGVDMGVVWRCSRGLYSLDLLMRLGLGSTHQKVSIAGSTTLTGSGGSGNNFTNATGGLLAQRTNIGDYDRNRFSVVPELGVTLGYTLTPQWRATVGYTFLYWSSVVRPGDQIDRNVNPNLMPPEVNPFSGLERPTFTFVESDLWVNGLSLGLERTW